MKKIALITTNKILAQSLAVAVRAMPDLKFEFILLLNSKQALLDAEIFDIDIALIDVALRDGIDCNTEEMTVLAFCEDLYHRLPNCHLLLLISQYDKANCKMVTEAKAKKIIDDFVFYDVSLKYLFAKMAAF
ncbi:hypothetical protein JR334_07445 [Clostridia bacterium]|nr:hypothetical protein JR334_07445 [Clostridia bacterium]